MRYQRSAYPEMCKRRTTAYVKLGWWDGQHFSCNPLFFCLARLEQSNDRVGIRYTRHWSQFMEQSQFLRLLQFQCSRFYYQVYAYTTGWCIYYVHHRWCIQALIYTTAGICPPHTPRTVQKTNAVCRHGVGQSWKLSRSRNGPLLF